MQVGKIDKMIAKDSTPKLTSKNSPGNNKAFAKEFNKALKEKAVDGSKENSADEKTGESSKINGAVEENDKPESKKDDVNIEDCSDDKKAVESSLELILSMLKGVEPVNPEKLQEALKAIEGSGEILVKSSASLNGNIQGAEDSINRNINSKINEIVSLMEKSNSEVSIKDLGKIATLMQSSEGAKETVDKIASTDSLGEQIKKILLSKMDKEINQIPEPRRVKVNELDEKSLIANEASNERTSLDVNSLQKAKEEKLLNGLLSKDKEVDKKDALINKATNFTAQFNTIKEDKISVEEPKMVITKNNMVQDVIKTVKFMQVNDLKELTVKIAPKELGEVIIKLTMDNGVMKANITATNKEAYNLLNNNLSDINGKLNNTEIKVQDFNLNLYNGDTTFFKDQNKRHDEWQQSKKGGVSRGFIDEEEAIDSIEEDNSNVNIYA